MQIHPHLFLPQDRLIFHIQGHLQHRVCRYQQEDGVAQRDAQREKGSLLKSLPSNQEMFPVTERRITTS